MNYEIEFEQEEDGRWIAEIPSLPGVMVYGASRIEAESKVQAMALRVVADPMERESNKLTHANLHASVPAALLARAEAIAQQSRISLDELAAQALRGLIARVALDRFRHEGKTRRSGLSDDQVENIVDQAIHEHRQESAR